MVNGEMGLTGKDAWTKERFVTGPKNVAKHLLLNWTSMSHGSDFPSVFI